jgi:hypothetical protein
MKKLNTIITMCFVLVFSGAAFFTTAFPVSKTGSDSMGIGGPAVDPGDISAMKKHFPIPTPGEIGEKSGPGYKSLPTKEPRVEEKKPYTEPAPLPPPVAMVEKDSLDSLLDRYLNRNEYTRTAAGAVIGWAVKHLCEMLFGLVKRRFKMA